MASYKTIFRLCFFFFYQETFDSGLQAFENEGIARVTVLKDELVQSQHEQSPAIIKRHDDLIRRWVLSFNQLLLQVSRPYKEQQRTTLVMKSKTCISITSTNIDILRKDLPSRFRAGKLLLVLTLLNFSSIEVTFSATTICLCFSRKESQFECRLRCLFYDDIVG